MLVINRLNDDKWGVAGSATPFLLLGEVCFILIELFDCEKEPIVFITMVGRKKVFTAFGGLLGCGLAGCS